MKEKEARSANIMQIMPALPPGWEAVWADPVEKYEEGLSNENEDEGYTTEPVVCWALVESEHGRRCVTALLYTGANSELQIMADGEYFLGYSSSGNTTDWKSEASFRRKWLAQQEPQPQQSKSRQKTQE